MQNWFVVVMGLVTVFVVLILIIGLCWLAAVSAAIAEASGTDASAIRILSVKKL